MSDPSTHRDSKLKSVPRPRGLCWLSIAIFLQMLPATLLVPAIRPLFAAQHAGNEHAMHAFMAVNMLGAILIAPLLAFLADRGWPRRALVIGLTTADAVLLLAMPADVSLFVVLSLRFVEGGAHVGAASLLLAEAADLASRGGGGKVMGAAGASLMFAVALGSALGGVVVPFDARAPFWLGSGLALMIAASSLVDWPWRDDGAIEVVRRRRVSFWSALREGPWVPLAAAFVGRFTVGCLVVTFALFAHKAHGLSDRAVGGLFSLLTLPFALLMYPVSRLGDRVSRALLFGGGGIAYAASIGMLALAPTSLLPLVMVCAGIGSACLFAGVLCYAAVHPRARAQTMSLVNVAGCLGMLFGPGVAGGLSATFATVADPLRGYRVVFFVAAFSVLSWFALSIPWLYRRLREELRDSRMLSASRS